MADALVHPHILEKINEIFSSTERFPSYDRDLVALYKQESDEGQKNILRLLTHIMSYCLKSEDADKPFQPMFTSADGTCSADICDLTETDIQLLCDLEEHDLPMYLLCRINDVLWVRNRAYKCAEKAVAYYLRLSDISFDPTEWTECVDCIRRANTISKQLGRKNHCFSIVCEYIDSKIVGLAGTDPLFLSLELIELQLGNNVENFSQYLPFVDSIINEEITSSKNVLRIEEAFKIKEELLKKANQSHDIREHYFRLAQYYESCAERILASSEAQRPHYATRNYKKALIIYKKYKYTDNANSVQRKLEPLQKREYENMARISMPIDFDLDNKAKRIEEFLNDCSFEEAIINLGRNTIIYTKQELKEAVINNNERFLSKSLFTAALKDRRGRTIVNIPPLDMKNPEQDARVLEMHMYRELIERASLFGIYHEIFLRYINKTHDFTEDDLDFIFKANAIIPEDRKNILRFGIFHGLKGNLYVALHILAPQMENIFRELAYDCGSIITSFDDDGTEEAKSLTHVFDLPELTDCYDEDILFVFKGLLNEKSGFNLRNQIAHGILDHSEANNSIAIYFLCVCIKIFSLCSPDSLSKMIASND